MLRTLVMVFHILLAVGLVGLILIQRGKGAEVGTAFGAGASGTVFGARGSASFLTRATGILAFLFFSTSLTLAFLSSRTTAPTSILEAPVQEQPAGDNPVAPVTDGSAGSTAAPEATTPSEGAGDQAPAESSDVEGAQPSPSDEDGKTPEQ